METIMEFDRDMRGQFMKDIIFWDKQKLAIESNKKLQEYKKTKSGVFFVESYFLGQIILLKENKSSFFEDYDRFGKDFSKLMEISSPSMLQRYFFDGKVFTLTKPVYDLLQNTKNKVFLRNPPFHVFAIDQEIKTKYDGLNIIFSIFFDVGNENESKGCNYLIIGKDERDDSEFWATGDILEPLKNYGATDSFPKEEIKELHRKTREMYSNFLDYLNHPYSKQTLYKLSNNTEKRIRRGKFPRQDRIIIDIKSEFIYENKIGQKPIGREYSSKFWVRGHFRHFRNQKRYEKLYKMSQKELDEKKLFYNGAFISKWIIPYIKGVGKLKEKIRRLK